jgi:hypothetical protein
VPEFLNQCKSKVEINLNKTTGGRMARKRGVGNYTRGVYKATVGGRPTKEYVLWRGLLLRCYDAKFHESHPTYTCCSVSDEFLEFQLFAGWCNSQVGFKEGGELDKDLLIRGNSHYCEDTCLFLPKPLNMLLINSGASRGALPVGVTFHKPNSKYRAQMSRGNSRVTTLGYFDTPEEAFQVYKKAKEVFIKQRAEEYRYVLDPRAYDALMNYQINIED